jgi:hypothetical protein
MPPTTHPRPHIPPHEIQLADISRWLLLFERGGLYVDADMTAILGSTFSPRDYLDASGVIFGYEAIVIGEEQRRFRIFRPKIICMWAALAVPGADILLDLSKYVSTLALDESTGSSTVTTTTLALSLPPHCAPLPCSRPRQPRSPRW